MCSRLIELISLTEVQNNLLRIVKWIFEIDEMEHEITNRVKDDILCQTLGNSHCLSFLFGCSIISTSSRIATVFFISTPKFVLECFAPHEVWCFVEDLFVFIFFFFCRFTFFLFFFLDSFLKSLIQNFLKYTFPNIFFLPYAMIVHILRQIILLQITFIFDFNCRNILLVWQIDILEINQLTNV